ncbi:MAG TPA: hypothetical protein VMV31_03250 [Terriglobales bacterium]|nr:hypothetical protein [Terriglobales bacterium]
MKLAFSRSTQRCWVCALFAALALVATAQSRPWSQWGQIWASAFSQWSVQSLTAVSAPGVYTLQIQTESPLAIAGGPAIQPLAANAPLVVGSGTDLEVATPSQVHCSWPPGACSVTIALTKPHQAPFSLRSGTAGLQEAINFSLANGGGTVVVDPSWKGTTAQLSAAAGASDVLIEDTRPGVRAWYDWSGAFYQLQASFAAPPAPSSLNLQSVDGLLNAGQFSGIGAAQLDNCAASLAGANGICWVPDSVAAGAAAKPQNGVDIWDARGTQPLIGNAAPYKPIFLSDTFAEAGTTNRVFGAAFQAHAQAGGTSENNATAETVALFAGAERTGGARPIWSLNEVAQYADHASYAIGNEIDLNNNGTDATDGQANQEDGLYLTSGGTARPLSAIRVDSSSANNTWQDAAVLLKYHAIGLYLGAGDAGSNAVYIVPPDNTSASEIVGRNAANTANQWQIANNGNLSAPLFNCTGCLYQVNGTTIVDAGRNATFSSLSLGGDAAMSAAPRMLFSAFVPELTSPVTAATWIPDKAITVTRIEAQAQIAPKTCSTNAVIELAGGSSSYTLTVGAAASDSGPISQNVAAGATLSLNVSTPAAGCTTTPASVNLLVQYRSQ